MRKEVSKAEKNDLRTLTKFVQIFCREKHGGEKTDFVPAPAALKDVIKKSPALCPDCTRLLGYAYAMRLRCPHDPKPMCKKCTAPCYRPEHQAKMREVMKFSGIYLVKHGRLDLLYHYFR